VTDPKTHAKSQVQTVEPGWVTVTEKVPRPLSQGWNLLVIPGLPTDPAGQPRTLLVYGDDSPPTFQLNTGASPLVINQADIDNGSTYHVSGSIVDDSFGTKHFETDVKLNAFDPLGTGWARTNPNHVEQVDANHILVVFPIYDLAGNRYIVKITLTVTNDAQLLRDIGQKTITVEDNPWHPARSLGTSARLVELLAQRLRLGMLGIGLEHAVERCSRRVAVALT
jgi:hypothetical protein